MPLYAVNREDPDHPRGEKRQVENRIIAPLLIAQNQTATLSTSGAGVASLITQAIYGLRQKILKAVGQNIKDEDKTESTLLLSLLAPSITTVSLSVVGSNAVSIIKSIARVLKVPSEILSSIVDNFDRANENPLASPWLKLDSNYTSNLQLSSNHVISASASIQGSYKSDALTNANQEWWFKVGALPVGSDFIAIAARVSQPGGASTWDGYWVSIAGGVTVGLYEVTNGVETILNSGSGYNVQSGDYIGIKCDGTYIQALYKSVAGDWTVLAGATDSAHTGDGYPGILIKGTAGIIDDFGGGQITYNTSTTLATSIIRVAKKLINIAKEAFTYDPVPVPRLIKVARITTNSATFLAIGANVASLIRAPASSLLAVGAGIADLTTQYISALKNIRVTKAGVIYPTPERTQVSRFIQALLVAQTFTQELIAIGAGVASLTTQISLVAKKLINKANQAFTYAEVLPSRIIKVPRITFQAITLLATGANAAFIVKTVQKILKIPEEIRTSIVDNFNRADENPLASTWANLNTSYAGHLQLSSNLVIGSSGNRQGSYKTDALTGYNQEWWLKIAALPTSGEQIGIAARVKDAGGANTWDGYEITFDSTSTLTIDEIIDSTPNQLSSVLWDWNVEVGDYLGIRCVEDKISALHKKANSSWYEMLNINGVSNINDGYPAIIIKGTNAQVDDFGGGAYIPNTVASLTAQAVLALKKFIVQKAYKAFDYLPAPSPRIIKPRVSIFQTATLLAIGSNVASIIRTPSTALLAIGSGVASITTQILLVARKFVIVATQAISSPERIRKSIIKAPLFSSQTFTQTLTAVATSSATLITQVFSRLFSYISAPVVFEYEMIKESSIITVPHIALTAIELLAISSNAVASLVRSPAQTLIASGAGLASLTTQTFLIVKKLIVQSYKAFEYLPVPVPRLLKPRVSIFQTATFLAIGTGIASLIRVPLQALLASGAGIVSLTTQALIIFKRLILKAVVPFDYVPPGQRIQRSRLISPLIYAQTFVQTLSAVANSVASLIKTPLVRLLSVGSAMAFLIKAPSKIFAALGGGNATITSIPVKVLIAIGNAISSIIRYPAINLLAIGSGSAYLAIIKVRLVEFFAAGDGVATLIRAVSINLSTSGGGLTSLIRSIARTYSVSGNGIAVLIRMPMHILAAIGDGSSSIDDIPGKVLSAGGVGIVTISRALSRTYAVVGTAIATITKSIARILSASGASIVFLVKQPKKILLAIAGNIASIEALRIPGETVLMAVATGGASLVRDVVKILDVSGIGHARIIKLVSRTFMTIGNGIAYINTVAAAFAEFIAIGIGQSYIKTTPLVIKLAVGSANATISRVVNKVFGAIGGGLAKVLTFAIHFFGPIMKYPNLS